MTSLVSAAADGLRGLDGMYYDYYSAREIAIQNFFANLALRKKPIPASEAYDAYDWALRRENSYAEITGCKASTILSPAAFRDLVSTLRLERESSAICRPKRSGLDG